MVVEIQDVLNDVVAEGILHKMKAVGSDLANEVDLLEAGSVVNAALQDTTAVAVRTNGDAVFAYRIEDELGFR
jgi:hypothetical protein